MDSAWRLQPTLDYANDLRWYQKKRPNELAGCLKNQRTYVTALEAGNKPAQIGYGFVHPEQQGVIALDQGRAPGLQETRMYIFPHLETLTLHLLLIKEKGSRTRQQEYVKMCCDYIAPIKQGVTNVHTHPEPRTATTAGHQATTADAGELQLGRGNGKGPVSGSGGEQENVEKDGKSNNN